MTTFAEISKRVRTWFYDDQYEWHSSDDMAYTRTVKMSVIMFAIFFIRLIVDLIFLDDGLRLFWDVVFMVLVGAVSYAYVITKKFNWTSMALNVIINGWMFYSANYFGRNGMIVLLMFCTAPYAYYVVGTRIKWLFFSWLLLPCVNLVLLELGDYNYFPGHKYLGSDMAWTRIMVVFASLTVLITLLFSTRMLVGKREGLLERSKNDLLKMVARIESLTEIKERNNTQLREKLQTLVDETKKISVESSLEALRSEERERNRISYELIEGLGGLLLAMKYRFEAFYPLVDAKRLDEYRTVVAQVDKALMELYATCGYLQTEQLKQLGLIESIRSMLRLFEENHKLKVVLSNDNYSDQLTSEQELIVYRMMVLMINSAVKHANADQCKVDVKYVHGVVYISQTEDGVEYTDGGNGINETLKQIRELAALVGGQVRHKSVVGRGATTVVQIPVMRSNA